MSQSFDADSVEDKVSDQASAEALFAQRNADWREEIRTLFAGHATQYPELIKLNRLAEQAFVVALARLAVRHGSWGDDFHAYHNELHARELIERHINLIIMQAGWSALSGEHWLLLWLFAACHDLRQREDSALDSELIGANEAASIAETWRILDACGFDRDTDSSIYQALRLLIASSTFRADGSHAGQISEAMNVDPEQAELARLAADVDTANVAEPLPQLARSAVRLIKELEANAGRAKLGRDSAAPVFEFLTEAQRRYFFEQQRFQSLLGRKVFGPRKQRNQQPIDQLCEGLRQNYPDGLGGVTGGAIIDEFLARAGKSSG